jgi:hypothetical protein
VEINYRNRLIKNQNTKLTIPEDKGLKFRPVLKISGKIYNFPVVENFNYLPLRPTICLIIGDNG